MPFLPHPDKKSIHRFSTLPILATAIAIAALAISCTDSQQSDSTAPSSTVSSLRFARPVNADTSQANLVWADSVNTAAPGNPASWSSSGIRGDGRDKYGQPSTVSEYQGKFCGVVAYLGVDGGSSLNADTDFGYSSSMATSCGTPSRLYRFYYDGAVTPTYSFGPHHTVINLGLLAVGQSVTQELWYGVQQTNCQRLYYSDSYSPSNNALITRLPNITDVTGTLRQWRVQSQASHRAMCLITTNGGKLVSSGVSHFLPFSYTITEVLPPARVFP